MKTDEIAIEPGDRQESPGPPREESAAELVLGADGSLLDLVDHLLNQGVVITGEVVLGLADIDLVYLRLSLLLSAADRVLPPEDRPR